jgi:hypothetical protein
VRARVGGLVFIYEARQLVEKIRQLYSTVTLFWKAPSSVHTHRLERSCYARPKCFERVRYMSNSRVDYLNRQQIGLMDERRVPVLDVLEGADWTEHTDAMHFNTAYNKMVLPA